MRRVHARRSLRVEPVGLEQVPAVRLAAAEALPTLFNRAPIGRFNNPPPRSGDIGIPQAAWRFAESRCRVGGDDVGPQVGVQARRVLLREGVEGVSGVHGQVDGPGKRQFLNEARLLLNSRGGVGGPMEGYGAGFCKVCGVCPNSWKITLARSQGTRITACSDGVTAECSATTGFCAPSPVALKLAKERYCDAQDAGPLPSREKRSR